MKACATFNNVFDEIKRPSSRIVSIGLSLIMAFFCLPATRAQENCDPCPEEPNEGESEIQEGEGVVVDNPHKGKILIPLVDSSDNPFELTFTMLHRIVTQDTPRERDLYGKMKLEQKSGDSGIVVIETNGDIYSLGSEIDVKESGHSGCGRHDWHQGDQNFKFTAITPGELLIEASVDPDADDGGDGIAEEDEKAKIKVFVVKAEIDPSEPDSNIICNSAGFYESLYGDSGSIYITPAGKQSELKDYLEIAIDGANPDTSDKGEVERDGYDIAGGPFLYRAKEETRDHKCESTQELEDQTVTLKFKVNDQEANELEFTVRSVFKFLTLNQSDFGFAIEYVNEKYLVGQEATYNPSLGNYGSTQVLTGSVQVGSPAMDNENVLASTLIHEQKHVDQGAVMRAYASQGAICWSLRGGTFTPAASYTAFERDCVSIWANAELAAYYAEVAKFSDTCLASYEVGVVTTSMGYYSEIEDYITHP